MSRVISFRDLRLIEGLTKYNEIELLHPDRDDEINKNLEELGFSTNFGVVYVPSKHRDLQGNVGVGFQAVGEIATQSEYLHSSLCPLIERILAASKCDMSLAREMAAMLGSSVNISAQDGIEPVDDEEEFPNEYIEEDYDSVREQIAALAAIRDTIRGSIYNEYGNIRLPEEYKGVK